MAMWYFEFYLVLMRQNVFHMSSLVTDTWTKISSFCFYNNGCGDNLSFSSSFISLEGSDAVFKFLQAHAVVLSKFLPKVLSHKLSKLSIFFSFYILLLVYFFTSVLYLSHYQIFLRASLLRDTAVYINIDCHMVYCLSLTTPSYTLCLEIAMPVSEGTPYPSQVGVGTLFKRILQLEITTFQKINDVWSHQNFSQFSQSVESLQLLMAVW